MTERPILFSAPMVRPILAGIKTQTRRAVNPQPISNSSRHYWGWSPVDAEADVESLLLGDLLDLMPKFSPYGQRGDRLWVREAWRAPAGIFDSKAPRDLRPDTPIRYEADGYNTRGTFSPGKYRPAMFMPRWASRILLEIVSIRVERLQDISYDDAKAEGWSPVADDGKNPNPLDPKSWYRNLWEFINGAGSWNANPWVWVIEFKVVKP